MKLDLYKSDLTLIFLRDNYHKGEWTVMVEDLFARLDQRPFNYRQDRQIRSDLHRIDEIEVIEGNLEGKLSLLADEWLMLGTETVEYNIVGEERPVVVKRGEAA